MHAFSITPLRAFTSNYIWVMQHASTCVVVDPGDASIVHQYLQNKQLQPEAIFLTHHHADHSGGIAALLQQYPDCTVFTSPQSPIAIPKKNKRYVQEGNVIPVLNHTLNVQVIETPGHTLDHVGFYVEQSPLGHPILFCGDTLFSAGCGRLFEGTPAQMAHTLARIQALPNETKVYPAHEYTLANLRWAHTVEPHNSQIASDMHTLASYEPNTYITLPSTIAKEKNINPFLRLDQPEVIQSASCFNTTSDHSPLSIFTTLRNWKDQF